MSMNKDRIYAEVLDAMQSRYSDEFTSGTGCLYFMHTGLVVLKAHGINAMPAAGSAHWEMQPDDGCTTHFGFAWNSPDNGQCRRLELPQGKKPLPEMHCWCFLPETEHVVDFSTASIPTLAQRMGHTWNVERRPPPYIWDHWRALMPRAIYIQEMEATIEAVRILVRELGCVSARTMIQSDQ